jgi:hypothetical protein
VTDLFSKKLSHKTAEKLSSFHAFEFYSVVVFGTLVLSAICFEELLPSEADCTISAIQQNFIDIHVTRSSIRAFVKPVT